MIGDVRPGATGDLDAYAARIAACDVVIALEDMTALLAAGLGKPVIKLRKSVDEWGQTVVMVTHDPRVASYADRVVVLTDGTITHDGRVQSADEVLQLMQAV